MSRVIQDANLELWEAYASVGDFGFPDHATIVFQCLSDRSRRARVVERDGNKAAAENEVATLSDDQLRELLGATHELK